MAIPILKPDDSIATLTLAELESLISHIVQQQTEQAPWSAQLQAIKQDLGQVPLSTARSLADIALELAAQVPEADWAQVPTDASMRYKEYLYGRSEHQK